MKEEIKEEDESEGSSTPSPKSKTPNKISIVKNDQAE